MTHAAHAYDATTGPSDKTEEMLTILNAIFQKIWVDEQDEYFDLLYTPDATFDGIDPTASIGLEDFKDLVREFRRHQKMLGYKVTDVISDGISRCAVRVEYDVYLESAEAGGTLAVQCHYSFRDGKASHLRVMLDRLAILEEIGAMPEGSYFIGLAGGQFS